jgi:hypothetical protein
VVASPKDSQFFWKIVFGKKNLVKEKLLRYILMIVRKFSHVEKQHLKVFDKMWAKN